MSWHPGKELTHEEVLEQEIKRLKQEVRRLHIQLQNSEHYTNIYHEQEQQTRSEQGIYG